MIQAKPQFGEVRGDLRRARDRNVLDVAKFGALSDFLHNERLQFVLRPLWLLHHGLNLLSEMCSFIHYIGALGGAAMRVSLWFIICAAIALALAACDGSSVRCSKCIAWMAPA